MTGGSMLRAWGATLSGLMVVLATLTACGPYQYYEGTGIHDTRAAEVAGGWENVEGTHVLLRKDGTALLEKLDGQDVDFDNGWRLSGKGTWQLTDNDGGQVVRSGVKARLPLSSFVERKGSFVDLEDVSALPVARYQPVIAAFRVDVLPLGCSNLAVA
uniref:hypothetical protein n=1 Tax=Streptomyces sp. S501 TaxID=2420135 RepID=UPI001F0F4714|nr:hypothetical protein [Streptomyces sp. S501]